jgi:hypothetical protein
LAAIHVITEARKKPFVQTAVRNAFFVRRYDQVRLRTDASRRFKKAENAEAMIWKLLCVAEKS